MTLAWLAIGGLGGLIAGSFIATLVIRWPDARTLGGRSSCDGCGRQLSWYELIPVVSFVIQRGRCRSCAARVDALHPLIELVCAAVGAAALAVAPGLVGGFGALFGWLLVALAALDLRHFWLPDRLVVVLAAAGLLEGVVLSAPSMADRVIGGAGAFGALWVIGFAYRRLRGREGLGGGDAKLFGAIGVWLGWQVLPFVLLGASAIGLVVALGMVVGGRTVEATTRLPLGTLLAVAAFPAWLLSR